MLLLDNNSSVMIYVVEIVYFIFYYVQQVANGMLKVFSVYFVKTSKLVLVNQTELVLNFITMVEI